MSKFIKPVNLWDTTTITAIESGALKLQVGQWVRCGNDGILSRFISYDNQSKTFNVVHRGALTKAGAREMNKRFKQRATLLRVATRPHTPEQRQAILSCIGA